MSSKVFSRPITRQKIGKGVKSITEYTRQLFSVSGVNGISHIALAKTTTRRIFWIVLFACSVTGWFFQTTTLLEYYYKYPTVVKIEVEKMAKMDFPGLTICNINRIRKSQFCMEYPDRCKNEGIALTEEEEFDVSFDSMKKGRKSDIGHQLEDMIISCSFSGSPQLDTEGCLEYFQHLYDPHLGNCYVFTSGDKPKLTVTEASAWQDIKDMNLVLNVEEDEYLNPDEDTPGMIITIHQDMEYPQIFTHGIHVHPDHVYNLAVEKISLHLLSAPYKTNCTDYTTLPFHTLSNLELSPRICTVECLMYEQKKECGHGYISDNIVLFEDEMPYDPQTVVKEDKKCADNLWKSVQDYCSSLCGVPCHDVHYTLSIDASPADHKLVVDHDKLEKYLNRTNRQKEIFASELRIHFQTMEHKTFRHYPEFNTETLFSYLGGITGGWLGISLLEFCAFLEGIFSVFIFSFRYCKPKGRNRKRKGRRSPRKRDPMFQNAQHQCHCQCRPDYGTLVLGLPVSSSPREVQIVPLQYY